MDISSPEQIHRRATPDLTALTPDELRAERARRAIRLSAVARALQGNPGIEPEPVAGVDQDLLRAAVNDGYNALWATVCATFPHVTSGDYNPRNLTGMQRSIREWIRTWLILNHPGAGRDGGTAAPPQTRWPQTRWAATCSTGSARVAARVALLLGPQAQVWGVGQVNLTDAAMTELKAMPEDAPIRMDPDNNLVVDGDRYPASGACNAVLDDITWAMLDAAGVDIDMVSRDDRVDNVYVWASPSAGDADMQVRFGPCEDTESGGTFGWVVTAYERVGDAWEPADNPEWLGHPKDVVERVAEMTR